MSTSVFNALRGQACSAGRRSSPVSPRGPLNTPLPVRACRGKAVRKQQQTVAVLQTVPVESRSASGSVSRLRVIGAISALADVQGQVKEFEVFAGRSAMIGFIAALAAELLTEHSIFTTVDPSEALLYSGTILAAMLAAAGAAAASKQQLGLDFKEAVITSLTAAQRSAASVTGKQVDRAVDHILSKAFNTSVIYSLLADEDVM